MGLRYLSIWYKVDQLHHDTACALKFEQVPSPHWPEQICCIACAVDNDNAMKAATGHTTSCTMIKKDGACAHCPDDPGFTSPRQAARVLVPAATHAQPDTQPHGGKQARHVEPTLPEWWQHQLSSLRRGGSVGHGVGRHY